MEPWKRHHLFRGGHIDLGMTPLTSFIFVAEVIMRVPFSGGNATGLSRPSRHEWPFSAIAPACAFRCVITELSERLHRAATEPEELSQRRRAVSWSRASRTQTIAAARLVLHPAELNQVRGFGTPHARELHALTDQVIPTARQGVRSGR
jgi:hypothetical protein